MDCVGLLNMISVGIGWNYIEDDSVEKMKIKKLQTKKITNIMERTQTIEYFINNILHREDGPAVIEYCMDNPIQTPVNPAQNGENKIIEIVHKYYYQGNCHRNDSPAIICFRNTDKKMHIVLEMYARHGISFRKCGPAIIKYVVVGNKSRVFRDEYYTDGSLRRDKPSIINYEYVGGKIVVINEEYHEGNKLHREDGPARITYKNNNGKTIINTEEFFRNGNHHRNNGPAKIHYEKIDGKIKPIHKYYYENGIPIIIHKLIYYNGFVTIEKIKPPLIDID